jgi:hypothetical protein
MELLAAFAKHAAAHPIANWGRQRFGDDQGHRRRHVRRAVYCPAAVTLHTVLPTSSAISKEARGGT